MKTCTTRIMLFAFVTLNMWGVTAVAQNGPSENREGRSSPSLATHRPDHWRYRRHNNEWWYWSPRDRWLYYREGRWNVYYPRRYVPYGYSRSGDPRWQDYGYPRQPDYRYRHQRYPSGGYDSYQYPYEHPYGARRYSGYPDDRYYRDRGYRRGANIGGAIGDALGGDVGAGIGSAIGGAIGDDD